MRYTQKGVSEEIKKRRRKLPLCVFWTRNSVAQKTQKEQGISERTLEGKMARPQRRAMRNFAKGNNKMIRN